MKKQELIEIHQLLDESKDRFEETFLKVRTSKRKIEREQAEIKSYDEIELALYHIENNPFLLKLLIGENASEQKKEIVMDDFKRPSQFQKYISQLLRKIEGKISQISEEEN